MSTVCVFVWERKTPAAGTAHGLFIDASTGLMIAKTAGWYFIRPLGCTQTPQPPPAEMPRCNYPDCAKSREGTAQISQRWYNIMSLGPFAAPYTHSVLCAFAASEFTATRSGCCVVVSLNLMKYACGLLSQLPTHKRDCEGLKSGFYKMPPDE